MSMTLDGTLGATFPGSLVVPPTNTRSMVRLNTDNGYGSTNTVIRRFANTVANQGSDITYADSVANGASFTINTNGVYAISYTDNFGSAQVMGLSLNSNQLTTSISGITESNILTYVTPAGNNFVTECSWVGYLAAGSVIRAHTTGSAVATAAAVFFTITRVS